MKKRLHKKTEQRCEDNGLRFWLVVLEHQGGSSRFVPYVQRDLSEVPTQQYMDYHAEGWDGRPGETRHVKGRAPGPTGGRIDIELPNASWNCLVVQDRILTRRQHIDLQVPMTVEECQRLGIHGVPGVQQ